MRRVAHFAYNSGYVACRRIWMQIDARNVIYICVDATADWDFVTCKRCLASKPKARKKCECDKLKGASEALMGKPKTKEGRE